MRKKPHAPYGGQAKSSPVGGIEAKGAKVDVFLNGAQEFYANVNGHDLKAASFDALRKRVLEQLGRKKVSLPVVLFEEPERYGAAAFETEPTFTDGVCTGKHAGTGALLCRFDERPVQIEPYSTRLLRYLDAVEREELTRLYKAHRDAERAYRQYRTARKFTFPEEPKA